MWWRLIDNVSQQRELLNGFAEWLKNDDDHNLINKYTVDAYLESTLKSIGMTKIKIELPKGFMNVGVSLSNDLIANTNDSENWDTLSFPLPKPTYKWQIHSYEDDNKIVNLIDKL